MNIEYLEEQLKIDTDDLDTVIIEHVENYYNVQKQFRLALQERDKCKRDEKDTHANLQLELREILIEVHGKTTESMVNASIEIHEDYQKIKDSLLNADIEFNKWSTLKSSYEQKSYALSYLVDLYIAGYFGAVPAQSAKVKHRNNEDESKLRKITESNTKTDNKNRDNGHEPSLDKARRKHREKARERLC